MKTIYSVYKIENTFIISVPMNIIINSTKFYTTQVT